MKPNYWLTGFLRRILGLFGFLAFLVFLGMQASPVFADAPSYVRLLQTSPDVGTVDVFVDGKKLVGGFEFATVTDYMLLPADTHKMQATLIGKGPGAETITLNLTVQAGLAYTVAAIGTEAPVQDIFGNAAGRFLNLMTCAGAWIPSEHQTSLRLVVYTTLD